MAGTGNYINHPWDNCTSVVLMELNKRRSSKTNLRIIYIMWNEHQQQQLHQNETTCPPHNTPQHTYWHRYTYTSSRNLYNSNNGAPNEVAMKTKQFSLLVFNTHPKPFWNQRPRTAKRTREPLKTLKFIRKMVSLVEAFVMIQI